MTAENEELILTCPHCKENIIIEKINCGIFRHGIFKNGVQIEPHTPKEQCENYIKQGLIYGCGLPFQIIKKCEKTFETVICDYI